MTSTRATNPGGPLTISRSHSRLGTRHAPPPCPRLRLPPPRLRCSPARASFATPSTSSGFQEGSPLYPSPSAEQPAAAESSTASNANTGIDSSVQDATAPGDTLTKQRSWWQLNSSELREKVAKLGLAAVLAYGIIDGITYTTFFALAFLGYEKSTGLNPARNLKALLSVVILMWTGNNVTRPFRVAGAAALAPFLDRALKKLQAALRLPSQPLAFALVVVSFASLCFSAVGLLILSRLGK